MEVYYLVFLLSVFWHGSDGIMWSLAPNTQKCLKEELHANVLVAGEYEATEAAGQRIDYIVSFTAFGQFPFLLGSCTSINHCLCIAVKSCKITRDLLSYNFTNNIMRLVNVNL